jgi:hypothetical protein
MASATWHTSRPKTAQLRILCPSRRAAVYNKGYLLSVALLPPHRTPFDRYLYATHVLLRHADITGRTPEYGRANVCEEFGVFLWGSRGQRGGPRRGWCGKFAGILQGKIRQRVSSVSMLMFVVGEGAMRSCWSCDPWQKWHAKKHRRSSLAHRSDLRVAYGGLTKRLLGWPTP